MDRRTFLGTAALATAGLGLPVRRARAASGGDLKFVFVFNSGGWDPTRVFAPEFSNRNVDMEATAARATAGGISYVDHPDRPSVRAFMDQHHSNLLVVNGVQVRSIAHEICTMIALTGDTSGFAPDWATVLAHSAGDRYTLPHLVLGGPSLTGELGTAVARTGANGQLEGLLSSGILDQSDAEVQLRLSRPAEDIVDRYLQRRASARAAASRSAVDAGLSASYEDALNKALGLKDYRYIMDFSGGQGFGGQAEVAVDALAYGLSRCVSIGFPGAGAGLGWDTHANNDDDQSALFEALFAGLSQLVALLETTPGETEATLADETVLVVLSEMGRTPLLNPTLGKDHWPYTSVMMMGPGITTDRVVGGFDDNYYGLEMDLGSAEAQAGGRILSIEAVGAALLELADLDPAEWVSGADPISGILS